MRLIDGHALMESLQSEHYAYTVTLRQPPSGFLNQVLRSKRSKMEWQSPEKKYCLQSLRLKKNEDRRNGNGNHGCI